MKLVPGAADYPPSLYCLDLPPALTVSGPLPVGHRGIAIVGSREATEGALGFVHQLAYHLARAGVVVVSGGAVGVDREAHVGALKAGGATWCVACTGRGELFPTENEDLFDRIEASASSRMIWPFDDGTPKDDATPRLRNGVLVGLAEHVVVVQAAARSGSRNAATWARELGRKLVIVPGNPWDHAYAGSTTECVSGGVDVLWSIAHFFEALGLPPPDLDDPNALRGDEVPVRVRRRPVRRPRRGYADLPLFPVAPEGWSDDEKLVFSVLSMAPTQRDLIIEKAGLPTSSTLTALLTLSLKDVVVEGPDGFFRCRVAL